MIQNYNNNDLNLEIRSIKEIASQYEHESKKASKMVRHFYDKGIVAPVWVVFETLGLSDLANYIECLNLNERRKILKYLDIYHLGIDKDCALLVDIIRTLKDLRNAVAHNNIVFDTRFKSKKVSNVLDRWLYNETKIKNVSFYSITDYIVLLCVLLSKIGANKKQIHELINRYDATINELSKRINKDVFAKVIHNNTQTKLTDLKEYLKTVNS